MAFPVAMKTRAETEERGKKVVMKSSENSVGEWPIMTALAYTPD